MESATCAWGNVTPSATSVLVTRNWGTSGKNENVRGGRFISDMIFSKFEVGIYEKTVATNRFARTGTRWPPDVTK
jgi:hypothetical protein